MTDKERKELTENNMKKYFSYDPNGDGLTLYATEIEAKNAAEFAISEERENAVEDGWDHEETSRICWGELKEIAAVITDTPDGVDYGLVKVEVKP
jgi:hypothetical protein